MKKLFISILVGLFIFAAAAPAMAKSTKPPKNLCIETNPGGNQIILGIKKGATLEGEANKVAMYAVQGILSDIFPTSGSGYMKDDEFFFELTGYFLVDVTIFGVWDVLANTGSMVLNTTSSDGHSSISYEIVSCP